MSANTAKHRAYTHEDAWLSIDDFVEVYKSCDATACAAAYAEDATILPGDRPIASGRNEIEALFAQIFKEGARKLTLIPNEVDSSGNLAYEIGTAILELSNEDGSVFTDERRYLTVLKRQSNGSWQIQASAWRGARAL
jgi:ketosteroid isomerase-like protein